MINLPVDLLQKFQVFQQNFQKMGQDPQQAVQQLLNSGGMSQSQFESLRQQANMILGTHY